MELQTTYVAESVRLNIDVKDVKTKDSAAKKGKAKKSSFFKPRSKRKKKKQKAISQNEPPVQLAPISRAPHLKFEATNPDSPDIKSEPVATSDTSVRKFQSEETNDEEETQPSAPQTLLRVLSRRMSSVVASENEQTSGKSRLPFNLDRLLSRSSSSANEKHEQKEDDDYFSEKNGDDVDEDHSKDSNKNKFSFVSKLSIKGLFSKRKQYSTDEDGDSKKKPRSLKKSLSRLTSFSRILSMTDKRISPRGDDDKGQSDRVVNYRSSSCDSEADEADIEVPMERPRKKSLVHVFSKPKPKQSPLAEEAEKLELAIEKKMEFIGHMDRVEQLEEQEISNKEKVDASHWGMESKYGVAAHDYDITKHVMTPVGSSSFRSAQQTCSVRIYSENEDDDSSSRESW
mmetsp:Transcript_5672/g.9263  ORF Transcript_5672/g.9263 Transcript_5672/m.9263 type:complete len:400 (-) Transcript_5672:444-1643(-)|eukprot:CAMPEP_0114426438 /NCGR_PEP_ID=MMETSP0103-20121206/7800_1 /TAXON_ID=37642 ORGANISM="Paraphysomonas imperforata, Strain PA2" /NCGR_SAMPLE_ID=MMETSP0103 /ASSEMBLY_ACC=CAM_ASM_000201 /LENGTH=399 /DNA_ID=CAMNT_0001595403 /DNA_START=84 /DNA_END=1283 /DNA_ORIENTATION=-